MTWHDAAGCSRKIYLPDHIEFHVALISRSQTRQRPGTKLWRANTKYIQHETGNERPGTGAWNHSLYLDNGALNDQGQPQSLSYHTCSDERIVVQKIPVDEAAYQAACGGCGGNYDCISNEMAVSVTYDKNKCRDTAEWVAAAFMEAMGIPLIKENITGHYNWNDVYAGGPNDPNRHKCPYYMMFVDGYWPKFQTNVINKGLQIAKMRKELESPVPPVKDTTYPVADLPSNFSITAVADRPIDNMIYQGRKCYIVQRNFKCINDNGASRLTLPGSRTAGAKRGGPRVEKGEKIFGLALLVSPHDEKTYILEESGVWLAASSFSPQIKITPRVADAD